MSTDAADPPDAPGLDRQLCTTTARFLAAVHCAVAPLGLGCSLMGAVLWSLQAQALAAAWLWLAGLVALTGMERLLALRLKFDAGLFADLARPGLTAASLWALDHALSELKLRAPATECRALRPRVQGAMRLAAWHAAVVTTQVLVLTAALYGAAAAGH